MTFTWCFPQMKDTVTRSQPLCPKYSLNSSYHTCDSHGANRRLHITVGPAPRHDDNSRHSKFLHNSTETVCMHSFNQLPTYLFLTSSKDTYTKYPLQIHNRDQNWTDAALVFSAELLLLPADAEANPIEFFLTAQDFDTLCPVLAKELALGQLDPARSHLPASLPPRSSYTVTWVSHAYGLVGDSYKCVCHEGDWVEHQSCRWLTQGCD